MEQRSSQVRARNDQTCVLKLFSSLLKTSPHECSSIHDHAGAHCFMKILGGMLEQELYDPPSSSEVQAVRVCVCVCVCVWRNRVSQDERKNRSASVHCPHLVTECMALALCGCLAVFVHRFASSGRAC
jgi:hypothetical protein